MILSGDKAGDPWHGAWSQVTGCIITPDSTEIELPGAAPAETGLLPEPGGVGHTGGQGRQGETYLFKSLDEALVVVSGAGGKSWLNHAILSGAQRRLYGKSLGAHRWLYRDTAGVVWGVQAALNITHPANGVSGSWYANPVLTFTRFGIFKPSGSSPDQHVVSIGTMALDTYGILTQVDIDRKLFYSAVEDISVDGRRAMFCIQVDLEPVLGLYQRYPGLIFEISLSGAPPETATATLSIIAGESISPHYVSSSRSEGAPVDYDSFSHNYVPWLDQSSTVEAVAGARYKDDGSPELIKLVLSLTTHQDGEYVWGPTGDGGSNLAASGSASVSGSLSFIHGSTSYSLFSVSGSSSYGFSQTWNSSGDVIDSSSSLTYTLTVGDMTIGRTIGPLNIPMPGGYLSYQALCPLLSSIIVGFPAGVFAFPEELPMYPSGVNDKILVYCRRYTNSLFGLFSTHSESLGSVRFFPVFGKIGSDAGDLTELIASPMTIYCSEHPISGAVLRSTTPTAFV